MREKQDRILVTFQDTAGAMAMERASREAQLSGRLIPMPRQIAAGCGLVWSAPPQEEERIREILEQKKMGYESILRMMV